jgi:curved DNA-binding protein CbpA
MTSTNSHSTTHYDVLGVPKTATQEEIKAQFRKLSKETHPDINPDTHGCGTKFKQIANAHSVLSNPTERRKYDRQLQEELMWGNRRPGGGRGFYDGTGNFSRNDIHRRYPKPGMHVAMETLSNPRYILMGVVVFGGVAMVGSIMGTISSKRPEYHYQEPLVEAWKNPQTGRWEQPAPWDPIYKQLQPKLEMVPREKVRQRIR